MPDVSTMDSVPVVSTVETTKTLNVLDELMKNLSVSKSQDEANAAATSLASLLNGPTDEQKLPSRAVETLKKQLANKKDALARERAVDGIKAIAQHATVSPAFEPYLVSLLPLTLAAVGDKMVSVKNAAQPAALALVSAVNPNSVKAVLPHLNNSILTAQKWQEKWTALECVEALVKTAPTQMAFLVPSLIPVISGAMWDTKPEIKKRAYGTMEQICGLIVNKDIEKFIPELIKCIAEPKNVPETVHLLGATTFVTDVHEPTLAIMVPLLERGLKERETAIKRKAAVIVDNMCKLVEDPNIVGAFVPRLFPQLKENEGNIADPEAREKTKQGLDTLIRVGELKEDGTGAKVSNAGSIDTVSAILKSIVETEDKAAATNTTVISYIAAIAGQLIDEKATDIAEWTLQIQTYVASLVGESKAKSVTEALRRKASPGAADETEELEDDEEGEDLCNCTFNLAYGAKILLNQTHLRLKRGQRYGLLGPNGSGKSTLMRAINNEQVEGFPKQNEVKTVFVEHDLDAADTEHTVMSWTEMKLKQVNIEKPTAEIEAKLLEFGFLQGATQRTYHRTLWWLEDEACIGSRCFRRARYPIA